MNNNAFFECLSAIQVWILSRIPTNPSFSMQSVYANVDYFFWRIASHIENNHFAWILWYIWNGSNKKVFTVLIKFSEILYSWQKHRRIYRMRHNLQWCTRLHKQHPHKVGTRKHIAHYAE